MDMINADATLITTIATILGVTIALFQLGSGRRDAQSARMAELSWQIYRTYEDKEIRNGRVAIEIISNNQPIPRNAAEYGAMYVTFSHKEPRSESVLERMKKISSSVRPILRFYHQVGILLEQKMIDPDFVFPLIGDGLETSEHGITVAVEWYQNYYIGTSRFEKAPKRRNIYGKAVKICHDYSVWKRKNEKINKRSCVFLEKTSDLRNRLRIREGQ